MRVKVAFLILVGLLVPEFSAKAAELDTENVRKGVVRIMALGADGNAELGSGFVINSSGNIVTNAHVIKPVVQGGTLKILTDSLAEQLKPEIQRQFAGRVESSGGTVNDQIEGEIIRFLIDKLPDAHVRWYDEKLDLAVLDCDAPGLIPLTLTTSNYVKEGQPAYALGFPGKGDRVGPTAFLSLKVYDGTIASKEENGANGESVYQTTTPFSPGNSGGPLMTQCGSVIGITSFHMNDTDSGLEALRFAIRIDELVNALKKQQLSVSYTITSGCGGGSGSSAILILGVVLALMLGAAAVVLAATNSGRRVVKDAIGKTVRLSSPHRTPAPAGAHQVIVKGLAGSQAGRMIPLDGNALVMGRDPASCQVVFPMSESDVSKRHCVLWKDQRTGMTLLDDLNSRNGTFVLTSAGNERVLPGRPRPLGVNERFSLGGPENVFELQAPIGQNQAVVPNPAVVGKPNNQPLNQPYGQPYRSAVPVLKALNDSNGEFAGRTTPVDQHGLTLGRDPVSCHVVLPASLSDVSKRHCSLKYDGVSGEFILEDLGSRNGTFVFACGKQERLLPGNPKRLRPGDRFFLGDPKILFVADLENQ
ncbi:MAG: FHA domain-containing protein [Blastocatellia bacterium]